MDGQIWQNRYKILRKLGQKLGRQTLLAQALDTCELVVIKVLYFDSDFDWEQLKLFEQEAQVLQQLSHQAIPRYLDSFQLDWTDSKGFALVQTYMDAPSLEEQLQNGRTFSEAELKQLACALLEILIYLHQQSPPIIHRDIKPGNILLSDRSGNRVRQVYLVDFGSVQSLAATEAGTITIVGTYGYMPPEQFNGQAVAASDLYSLGATLIYLMTGRHPADLPQKDLRIEFEEDVNASSNLGNWLKRMIQPSLERRFASAAEALQSLKNPSQALVLTINQRPFGSKVQLRKTNEAIEITIPPLLESGYSIYPLLTIFWNTGTGLLALFVLRTLLSPFVAFEEKVFAVILFIPFVTSTFFLSKALLPSIGNIHLRIDSQQIHLAYELLGLKLKASRTTLSNYWENEDVSFKIICPFYKDKYSLNDSSNKRLTLPEVEWLSQELDEWLDWKINQDS